MFVPHVTGLVFRRQVPSMALAGCLALILLPGSDLWAQAYKSIEPEMTRREASNLYGSQVVPALRNAGDFPQKRNEVTRYYQKYFFPKLTQYRASDLADLARDRIRFFNQVRGSNGQQAQEHLTAIALQFGKAISRDYYHPAVRYNAVLILGDLDQSYARGGANASPPVPLPDATRALLELVESEVIDGVSIPESVKLAALIGLERHTRWGVDPQLIPQITAATLAVMNQQDPPAEVTRSVHNWLRTNAAHVLRNLNKEGPSKEVHDAFISFIADDSVGVEDRCFVAGLMEKMDYTNVEEIDGPAAVLAFGKLFKSIAEDGAELANKYRQEALERAPMGGGFGGRPRGGGGFGGEGGRGFGGGFARGMGVEEPQFERRQILARLTNVSNGAVSLANALKDEQKEWLTKLGSLVAPVRRDLENANIVPADLTGPVIQLDRSVSSLISTWQQPEAPAGEEPAEEEPAEDLDV